MRNIILPVQMYLGDFSALPLGVPTSQAELDYWNNVRPKGYPECYIFLDVNPYRRWPVMLDEDVKNGTCGAAPARRWRCSARSCCRPWTAARFATRATARATMLATWAAQTLGSADGHAVWLDSERPLTMAKDAWAGDTTGLDAT